MFLETHSLDKRKKKTEYRTLETMLGADFRLLKDAYPPEKLRELEKQMESWDNAKLLPNYLAEARERREGGKERKEAA